MSVYLCIAVHGKKHPRATVHQVLYEITQCYLPPNTDKLVITEIQAKQGQYSSLD